MAIGYYVIGGIDNLGIKAGNKALEYHTSTLRKNPHRLMLIDRNISMQYCALEYLQNSRTTLVGCLHVNRVQSLYISLI